MSANYWPDTTRVEHGDFTLDLAEAAVRNIAYKGAQLIDLLYTAIRPWDWSTLVASSHAEDVNVNGAHCIVTISDTFAGALEAQTIITLTTDNTFSVDYQLKGLAEYSVNRWGICFCLHSGDWMGSTVNSSGNTYKLLQDISPQRVIDGVTQGLFPASNEMHFVAPD